MAIENIPDGFVRGLGQILGEHLNEESAELGGDDFDLDGWISPFEDEFPTTQGTYSPEALRAIQEKPWGLPRDERPKIQELNQPPDASGEGWRIVDLYPNREQKDTFYRLVGTPSELRILMQLINHLHRMVGGGEDNQGNKKIFPELLQLSSCPYITIEFKEEEIPPGKRTRLHSKLTLALTEYVEHEKFKVASYQKILGIPELKQFATRIITAFYPNNTPYILRRGDEVWTYANWPQGYHCWCPFRDQSAAYEFFQKYITIQLHQFEDRFLTTGKAANPFTRYPVTPDPITVAGQPVYLPERFRKGECLFWKAWCWLPKTRQKITLVSRSKRDPVDDRIK